MLCYILVDKETQEGFPLCAHVIKDAGSVEMSEGKAGDLKRVALKERMMANLHAQSMLGVDQ